MSGISRTLLAVVFCSFSFLNLGAQDNQSFGFLEVGKRLVIEAEHYNILSGGPESATFVGAVNDNGSGGNAFIRTESYTGGSPYLQYYAYFRNGGTYSVYVRAKRNNGSASFQLSVDNASRSADLHPSSGFAWLGPVNINVGNSGTKVIKLWLPGNGLDIDRIFFAQGIPGREAESVPDLSQAESQSINSVINGTPCLQVTDRLVDVPKISGKVIGDNAPDIHTSLGIRLKYQLNGKYTRFFGDVRFSQNINGVVFVEFYSGTTRVANYQETVQSTAINFDYDVSGVDRIEIHGQNFGDGGTGVEVHWINPRLESNCYYTGSGGTGNNNLPPVARFIADPPSIEKGQEISFDGALSFDPDGTVMSYTWNLGNGATRIGKAFSYNYSNEGEYDVSLTVTDNHGKQHTASKSVVVEAPPKAPIAAFEISNGPGPGNGTYYRGEITLDASGSNDPDGNLNEYTWNIAGQEITRQSPGYSHTFSSLGNFTIQLKVKDNDNLESEIVSQQLSIINQLPMAIFTIDNTGIIEIGQMIAFDGTPSNDPDGTISSYAWDFGDGGSSTNSKPNHSFSSGGSYTVRLEVIDNDGGKHSTTKSIVVKPPPIAAFDIVGGSLQNKGVVEFDASNSGDLNGEGLSYAWDFGNGNTGSGTNPNNNYPNKGSYDVTLTVTNESGLSDSQTKELTIRNRLPTAEFEILGGNNREVGATIEFSAARSNDPDGEIDSYSWDFGDGSGGSGLNIGKNYNQAGTYTISLTVTDNDGAGASTSQLVSISVPNQAPKAVISMKDNSPIPAEIKVGTQLNFSGENSTDNDGNIVEYSWKVDGSTVGSQEDVSYTLDQVKIYTIRLQVTDNDRATGETSISTQTFANQAPIVHAGQDVLVNILAVDLNGSASDPDGEIDRVQWSIITKPLGANDPVILSNTSIETQVGELVEGEYVFELKAWDNDNATATDRVRVIVELANRPPTANAGQDQSVTLPDGVTLFGSGSDQDPGDVISYAWSMVEGDGSAVISNPSQVTTSINFTGPGMYKFKLTVTDNEGATDSDNVIVTVNPEPNDPPTANAGQDFSISLPTNIIQLDGNGSFDPDGEIASYYWEKIAGNGPITWVGRNNKVVQKKGLQADTYRFRLTVTDDKGVTDTDVVEVIVQGGSALTGCYIEQEGWVFVEAENFTSTINNSSRSWERVGSSGAIWIAVEDNGVESGNPSQAPGVNYDIQFSQTGQFLVRVLAKGKSNASNSFFVTLDGQNISGSNGVPISNLDQWEWVTDGVSFSINETGIHTFGIRMREDGTEVDKIMLHKAGFDVNNDVPTSPTGDCEVNQIPIANAGVDELINYEPDISYTLDGRGSYDPDNNVGESKGIASISWSLVAKPEGTSNPSISSLNVAQPVLSNLAPGMYRYKLIVTDESGADSNPSYVDIECNQKPTADFQVDISCLEISVNANTSTDPEDDNIQAYHWFWDDGNTESTSQAQNAHRYSTAGTFTLGLEVEDEHGHRSERITRTVDLSNQAPPVAAFSMNPSPANEGQSIRFDASNSDEGSGTNSYSWNLGDNTSKSGVSFNHTYATVGEFLVKLTLEDACGQENSKTKSLTVNNLEPVAVIEVDLSQDIYCATEIDFDGSSSYDHDPAGIGSITQYSWAFDDGITATGPIVSHAYSNPGTYTVRLTVTDDEGTTQVETVSLNVIKESQSISFPTISNKVKTSEPFTISANASSELACRFEIVSGPATIFGNLITLDGTLGTVVVKAKQDGNDCVNDVEKEQSFDVTDKQNQDIVFDAIPDLLTMGDEYRISANASSGLDITFHLVEGEGSIVLNGDIIDPQCLAGTVTIEARQAGNATYNAVSAQQTFQVKKSPQTISFAPPTQVYTSTSTINLVASANSGLPVNLVQISGPASLSGSIMTLTREVGTIVLEASQTGDVCYLSAETISRNIQVIEEPVGSELACFQEKNGEIIIETENYSALIPASDATFSGHQWQAIQDASVSGGTYMQVLPNSGANAGNAANGPGLAYEVNFESTGIFYAYVRSTSPNGDDDSYHIALDGQVFTNNGGTGMGLRGNWDWSDQVKGGARVSMNIPAPGKYNLKLLMREDGAKVDKIILRHENANAPNGYAQAETLCNEPPQNQAPIAVIQVPDSVFVGDEVLINGSGSHDPDGTITSYTWNLGDGNTASGENISHAYTQTGTFDIALTVADDQGISGSASQEIFVQEKPQNQAPVAVIQESGERKVGESLSFDGSGSYDIDGSIVAYTWDFGDGNVGSSQAQTHVYTSPGGYTVRLIVEDDEGLTDTASISLIIVEDATPTGDCFTGINGQIVIEAENYSSLIQASDGAFSTYQWQAIQDVSVSGGIYMQVLPNNGANVGNTANGPGMAYEVNFEQTGTYYVYVRSTSENGDDDSYHIALNELVLTNSEGTGMGRKGDWGWAYQVTGGSRVSMNVASPGKYTLKLLMREDGAKVDKIILLHENAGAPEGFSQAQTLCNEPQQNQAPTAVIQAPDTVFVGDQIAINASDSSDPDGTITRYDWTLGDGNTALGESINHSYTETGSFVISLKVTDNNADTARAEHEIFVQEISVNQAPVAIIQENGEKQVGATIRFNGSASFDNDGTIVSYVWIFGDGNTGSGQTVDHSYTAAGSYTVSLGVTDDDGLKDTTTFVMIIHNTSPAPEGPCYVEKNGQVVMEAENYMRAFAGSGKMSEHTWVSYPNTGAMSGSYLIGEPLLGKGTGLETIGPRLEYDFYISEPGTFYLHIHSQDGSYHVGIDDVVYTNTEGYGMNGGSPWNWAYQANRKQTVVINLANSGDHVLKIWLREDGAKIDKVVLRRENTPEPIGSGPEETLCEEVQLVPPVAVIDGPTNGSPKVAFSFNGTNSFDEDGQIVSYRWNMDDGSIYNTETISHRFEDQGEYVVSLTVTDNDGLTATSTQTISVEQAPLNQPPVAIIQGSTQGHSGTAISFFGEDSNDPDGEIVSYVWNFGDGNFGADMNPDHIYEQAGVYTLSLTVTDNEGLSHTATHTISVLDIVVGGGECFVAKNGEVIIEAEHFHGQVAGTWANAANHAWEVKTGLDASSESYIHLLPNENRSTSLNVNGPHVFYHITFEDTGNYYLFVRSSAPNGDDDSYHVGLDDLVYTNLDGFGMGRQGDWGWADNANRKKRVIIPVKEAGTHTLRLYMREDGAMVDKIILRLDDQAPQGLGEAESAGCAPHNLPPVAIIDTEGGNHFPGDFVGLEGIGSYDPDGYLISYQWNLGAGNLVDGQFLDQSAINAYFPSAGEYPIFLIVQDNVGATDTATYILSINSHNEVWLEAECAELGEDWNKMEDFEASADQYVTTELASADAAQDCPSAWIRFHFQVYEFTTYAVFARMNIPSAASDGLWIRANGSDWVSFDNIPVSEVFTWTQVHDSDRGAVPITFQLIPGFNTIDVSYKDPNIVLDKLFITATGIAPAGIGPELPCVEHDPSEQFVSCEWEPKALIANPSGVSPTTSQNYVLSKTYRDRGKGRIAASIGYFDGLGRPIQSIDIGGAPSGQDIVSYQEYDGLGRQTTSYLPYSSGRGGSFQGSAHNIQQSFYNRALGIFLSTEGSSGEDAKAETLFEPSPLNRVLKQGAPGAAWNVNGSAAVSNAYGSEGNYFVHTKTDENGVATVTKRDIIGRTLSSETAGAATRYVYNDLNQIEKVLQPMASGPNDNKFVFSYVYNDRGLVESKQIPGQEGTTEIRYDELDRVIATRDPNGTWLCTEYDDYSRPVKTGFGSESGVVSDPISYTFYDGYAGLSHSYMSVAPPSFAPSGIVPHVLENDKVKGLVTGVRIKVLDEAKWLETVTFYDDYGREIQTIADNYLGGKEISTNFYNFAGERLANVLIHNYGPQRGETIIVQKAFHYDHRGRLLRVTIQSGDESPVVVSEHQYNELGQLATKELHLHDCQNALQTVDYLYNIRGWMTQINDPHALGSDLFGMELQYTQNDLGTTGLYNGNISATQWRTVLDSDVHGYGYEYDQLNRIKKATYQGSIPGPGQICEDPTFAAPSAPKFDTEYKYDLNGNIQQLSRYGLLELGQPGTANTYGLLDNLNYTYDGTGNRLSSISEAALQEEIPGIDHYAGTGGSYTYDANGNIITDEGRGLSITYNHLNKPTSVNIAGKGSISWKYAANGTKLQQTTSYADAGRTDLTDYVGSFFYKNDSLLHFVHEEGRVLFSELSDTQYQYEYNLTDHLGNVRVSFGDKDIGEGFDGLLTEADGEILDVNHYYPFGLRMSGVNPNGYAQQAVENRFKYNGKELHGELGLGWYDYGARMYDASLGRWNGVDRLAEKYNPYTSYSYVQNKPIVAFDINGDSTVVFISGYSNDWYTSRTNERFLRYEVLVFTDMSLTQFSDLYNQGNLPAADYSTAFARDAHDLESTSQGTISHSEDRYGLYNEIPPGTWYLFRPGTNGDGGGGSYDLYIGSSNGSRLLHGPQGVRSGLSIHQYDPRDSQGCLTSCTGTDTQPIQDLIDVIPDLNNDSQPVYIHVEPRPVEELRYENIENGRIKFKGTAAERPLRRQTANTNNKGSWWDEFTRAWNQSMRALDRSIR